MALFESLVPGALTAAAGVSMAKDITDSGQDISQRLNQMGQDVNSGMGFKGYGVRTGLGNSNVSTDGSVNLGVGPDQAMLNSGQQGYQQGMTGLNQSSAGVNQASDLAYAQRNNDQLNGALYQLNLAGTGLGETQRDALNASQDMMGRSLQSNAAREQEIYGRMMDAQQPGMDRARAGMEARAYAQGRGGISGSQYGGSGEQFAQSRAEAEARNSAMLGAMSQAQNEQRQQGALAAQYGQLGQGYAGMLSQMAGQRNQFGIGQAQLGQSAAGLMGQLGAQRGQLAAQQAQLGLQGAGQSYMPMDQQMKALQLGMGNADMAQTGQISGQNMLSQLGLGGAQIEMNANKAASELYGNMFGALAGEGGAASTLGAILDDVWPL